LLTPAAGRDAEGLDLAGSVGRLTEVEDGQAGCGGHLPRGRHGRVGDRSEPGGVALLDGLRLRIVEQEDEVAGCRIAGCRDGQDIFSRARDLAHRIRLDRRDGVRLAAAVGVTEVGERRGERGHHGEHLEGDQEDRPREEVLDRDVPRLEIDREDDQCHSGQQPEPHPLLLRDQRDRQRDGDRSDDAKEQDLADEPAGRVGS
jgi:hypothetical protein